MPLPLMPCRQPQRRNRLSPRRGRRLPANRYALLRPLTPQPAALRPVDPSSYLYAIINNILLRLNEVKNTVAFDLDPGDGGAAIQSRDETIIGYINEAAQDLFTTTIELYGQATWQVLPVGYNVIDGLCMVPYASQNLATGSTAYVWAATGVSWNGAPLKRIGINHLTAMQKKLITTPGSHQYRTSPAYWGHTGVGGVFIYPAPTTGAPLTLYGACVPRLITSVSDRPDWMMPHHIKFLEWYACAQVCIKNSIDPDLGPLAGAYTAACTGLKSALLQRMHQITPDFANQFEAKIMAAVMAITARKKTGFEIPA